MGFNFLKMSVPISNLFMNKFEDLKSQVKSGVLL